MWSGPVSIWSGPDKNLLKKKNSMSVVGHGDKLMEGLLPGFIVNQRFLVNTLKILIFAWLKIFSDQRFFWLKIFSVR